jgi:hypothetical protein
MSFAWAVCRKPRHAPHQRGKRQFFYRAPVAGLWANAPAAYLPTLAKPGMILQLAPSRKLDKSC